MGRIFVDTDTVDGELFKKLVFPVEEKIVVLFSKTRGGRKLLLKLVQMAFLSNQNCLISHIVVLGSYEYIFVYEPVFINVVSTLCWSRTIEEEDWIRFSYGNAMTSCDIFWIMANVSTTRPSRFAQDNFSDDEWDMVLERYSNSWSECLSFGER